jgi:hypothetical protein
MPVHLINRLLYALACLPVRNEGLGNKGNERLLFLNR